MGLADEEIAKYVEEASSPQQGTNLVFGSEPDETEDSVSSPTLRESQYGLEQDDNGN